MANEIHIQGDPTRQALASLRGYAYQLYASALAWMSLKDDEVLFLEVAEDYAIATENALQAIQVKNSTASITLNSQEVIETINSFFQLSSANPGKIVNLKHLTTAKIGLETKKEDRVCSESGLHYWMSIRNDSDVEPLRKRLLFLDISNKAKHFLENNTIEHIRNNFINRIEWLSEAKNIENLKKTIKDSLVYLGEKKSIPSYICDQMIDPLISRVLTVASSKGIRRLDRADFIRFFEDRSRIELPIPAFENILSLLNSTSSQKIQNFVSSVAMLRQAASVNLSNFAERKEINSEIKVMLSDKQFVCLYGATGTGKSSLAKFTAQCDERRWCSAQLRSLGERDTIEALYRISSQIMLDQPGGVVLDDLGQLISATMKEAFYSLVEGARKNAISIIVTSNHKLSSSLLANLALDEKVNIKVGNFSEAEIAEYISKTGGDPVRWARYVYLVAKGGHPLLVDALVRGLARRDWPLQELKELRAFLGKDEDIEGILIEARKRLFLELDDDERLLLLKLSLVLGTFDRELALFMAEHNPAAKFPGAAFENLLGAWIEVESEGRFRVSSLVSSAGRDTFDSATTKKLNYSLASYYTKDWHLNANRFDDIILHGLIGKNDQALTVASLAIISASDKELETVPIFASKLLLFRTDELIYSHNSNVSRLLRFAQVMALAVAKKASDFHSALKAFEQELLAEGEYLDRIRSLSVLYMKLISINGLIYIVGDLPEFFLKAAHWAEKAKLDFGQTKTQLVDEVTTSAQYIQFMFAHHISHITSFELLRSVLSNLISKSKTEREFLLKAFDIKSFSKAVAIKAPWLEAVDNGEIIDQEYAESYARLGRDLAAASEVEFASAAFEVAAVIWDEGLSDPEKAKSYLDEALILLGDNQNRQRALSRILFHEGRYNQQLKIGMPIFETFRGSPIEAAYFLRELAIGNSRLGNHEVARKLYLAGHARLTNDRIVRNTPMAAGLLADAAVEAQWIGHSSEAVKLFYKALIAVEALDPLAGLRNAAVHRLVPHSIVWLMFQITGWVPEAGKHEMLPGINSNPNPHKDLESPAELSIDHVWYVLAEIENKIDEDCGVVELLLSKNWDMKAILANEIGFYPSILQSAERRLLENRYLEFASRALDAYVFVEKNGPNLMQQGLAASPRERLPELDHAEFQKQRGRLIKSLFLISIRLTFQKTPEIATKFVQKACQQSRPLLENETLETFMTGQPTTGGDELALAGTIGYLVRNKNTDETVHVSELLLISLRLLELLESGFVEESTVSESFKWLRNRWKSAIAEQAFSLSSPQLALQAFEKTEQYDGSKIQDIAGLILLVEPFIKLKLDHSYLDWLRTVKQRNRR